METIVGVERSIWKVVVVKVTSTFPALSIARVTIQYVNPSVNLDGIDEFVQAIELVKTCDVVAVTHFGEALVKLFVPESKYALLFVSKTCSSTWLIFESIGEPASKSVAVPVNVVNFS